MYEISQAQYTEFLNKLSPAQDGNRYFPLPSDPLDRDRYAITGDAGNRTTNNPYVACGNISWADFAAYLDWAALRPMTELEFEKACRGTAIPVANEYAWGTANIAASAYVLSNPGASSEGISSGYSTTSSHGNASHRYGDRSMDKPLRCGIFAAHVNNTGRISAGATYYGIMEMSGNIIEFAVTVGNPEGRAFTGSHGDGTLDNSGDATITNWPGISAVGTGSHGGSWESSISAAPIGYRHGAAYATADRWSHKGGRGVRSAP